MTNNIINSKLISIKANVNFDALTAEASAATSEFACNAQTTLKDLGQTIDGITSLVQADFSSSEGLVNARLSLANITSAVPGLSSDLVGDVSGEASDLDLITGSTSSNGSLKIMVGSASPEAIAFALSSVTGRATEEIQSLTTSFTSSEFQDGISKISASINVGIGQAFGLAINDFSSSIASLLRTNVGYNLSDVSITLNSYLVSQIKTLGTFTDSEINQSLNLLISGDILAATDYIESVTGADRAVIHDLLVTLDTDVTNDLSDDSLAQIINRTKTEIINAGAPGSSTNPAYSPDRSNTSSPLPYTLHGNSNSGNPNVVATTVDRIDPAYFTYVNTQEEMIAELRSSTREITTVIAHWTGTYTNQDIGAEEVNNWHVDRGWAGCGYHYLIRRDGKLQRGRPLNRQGAHAGNTDRDFNPYSIGIAMVGGYNCPSGTVSPHRYISAESLTAAQMKTYEMFMDLFYQVHPGGQAFGHVDVDNKGLLDPGFDVAEYVRIKFGKYNLTNAPRVYGPASSAIIAAGRYS